MLSGTAGVPPPLTVIVNSRCAAAGVHQSALGGFWSLRLTQNAKLPGVVGVPLIAPPNDRDKPGGSEPLISVYWYGSAGPQPPAPANVLLYDCPTVPAGMLYLWSVKRIANAAGTTTKASSET